MLLLNISFKNSTHLESWFGKQYLTKLTIFLLKMASPHCGYICASSGQWFGNIFPHISHLCVCKDFLLCEKTYDSFGKLVWETISYKTNNFLFKNVFAPLWLYLRIFRPVAKFVHHRDSVFCKTFSTNITIMSL